MTRLETIAKNFYSQMKKTGQEHSLKLSYLDFDFTLYYDLSQEEDPMIINLYLDGNFGNDLLMAYLSLIDKIALEALKRVTAKELDYYIRDDQSRSFFKYYGPEVYKLLGLGEKIYNKHLSFSQDEVIFDPNLSGEFLSCSYSEQIETFEEFLSLYVYPSEFFHNQDFELDVVESELKISYTGTQLNHLLQELIKEKLPKLLYLKNYTVTLNQIN